jgi:DNA segregation ATPase FtsK/SpoIIIE-like protein
MIRVMVTGAAGRMGRAVVDAVNAAPDTELVAMADPVLEADGSTSFATVADAIAVTSPDVAVDFTQPHVAFETVKACLEEGYASISLIQRRLGIGYNKAARLVEQMETEGIIGPASPTGKREILVRRTHDDD